MSGKNNRRFSLEDDFMNYQTDDLLYGFMRSISTALPIDKYVNGVQQYEEYLTIANFKRNKKVIANICGVCLKTIGDRVKKLISNNLVAEKELLVNGKMTACYVFPYDYNGRYKIIDKELLGYLVETRNSLSIRIYLYLLNCYQQKQEYSFTIRELKKAFGYAESTTSADSVIGSNLKSFKKEGIINYTTEWQQQTNDQNGAQNKTERMVLRFVATKKQP